MDEALLGSGRQHVGDEMYTCPRCGDEITERRREAHDKYWCEALPRDTCSSSEHGSETDDHVKGVRLRRIDKDSASCQHDLLASDRTSSVPIADGLNVDSNDADDLTVTPAESRKRARLNFCFLLLIVGPACCSGLLYLQEFLNPFVLQVPSKDAATVQNIFFGGRPWLVYCVKKSTAGGPHLSILRLAGEQLRQSGVSVAEVHCWVPLPTRKGPQTLAKRFAFRDSPPIIMFTAGKGKPHFLGGHDFSPKGLVREVLQQLDSPSPQTSASKIRASASGMHKSNSKRPGGRKDYVGQRPQEEYVVEEDDDASDIEYEEVIDLDR